MYLQELIESEINRKLKYRNKERFGVYSCLHKNILRMNNVLDTPKCATFILLFHFYHFTVKHVPINASVLQAKIFDQYLSEDLPLSSLV